MECFPNVKKLYINAAILGDYSPDTYLATGNFHASLFVRIMSFAFPNLRHLELMTDLPSLSGLEHFHHLRSLHFSGYSKTPLDDTLSILQSLKHLDSIKIDQPIIKPEHAFPGGMMTRSRAGHFQDLVMTPAIISQMNPLKNITIKTIFDMREASLWYSVPLTRALMDAFLVHSQSLQSLKICQTFFHPPLKDVFEILDFAQTAGIPHIYIYLTLPRPLARTLDPKDFLSPTTGKRMDIILNSVTLEIRTGRYFPSTREVEQRSVDTEEPTFYDHYQKLWQNGS